MIENIVVCFTHVNISNTNYLSNNMVDNSLKPLFNLKS